MLIPQLTKAMSGSRKKIAVGAIKMTTRNGIANNHLIPDPGLSVFGCWMAVLGLAWFLPECAGLRRRFIGLVRWISFCLTQQLECLLCRRLGERSARFDIECSNFTLSFNFKLEGTRLLRKKLHEPSGGRIHVLVDLVNSVAY